VLTDLALVETSQSNLFRGVAPVPPSPVLAATLAVNIGLATTAHSEASRATWMVGPVLADLWARYDSQISLFAGVEFAADPAAGLTGYCDFVIGRGPHVPHLRAPLAVLFEAKRDSIPDGLGQCIAAMVGAERFNRRNNNPIDPVYGCVTTGTAWKFLRLSGGTLTIDVAEYTIQQSDMLLGILTHMVGPVPTPAAA
jgi:hypothetical protein